MATRAKVGFGVNCPLCGVSDVITLDLNDLRDLSCNSCGESFTVETALNAVRDQLARWEAINDVFTLACQRAEQL